jgi:hypothetical protein
MQGIDIYTASVHPDDDGYSYALNWTDHMPEKDRPNTILNKVETFNDPSTGETSYSVLVLGRNKGEARLLSEALIRLHRMTLVACEAI